MKRRMAVLLVLGILPWAGLGARETATATTTFSVTAKVEGFCEVIAPDLDLGDYAAQGGARLQAATPLRATCTPKATYLIDTNKGTSPGAATHRRNTTGMVTVTGVGTGQPVDHTLFGGVPAVQFVPPGDYAEPVWVRVYF